jgi:endonuclease/exonuclease/phosphatase family metal-dependent hydrolase
VAFELLAGRDHSAHPELALWHGNIGEAVALDLAPPAPPGVTHIDLLCWNVAIGRGFLDELVARLRTRAFGQISADPKRPFVFLAQEALRADPSVPEIAPNSFHGGHIPVGVRRDIVDFAAEHDFSLRYAPSMRNGKHRSDRGNAIISNVAIAAARAFTLPYIKQRRVIVKVELEGIPDITFVTGHLDVGGRLPGVRLARYGAGRSAQSKELVARLTEMGDQQSFVLGADLNTAIGARDPAFRVFTSSGFHRAAGSLAIGHTFHGPGIKLQLDHLLYRSPTNRIKSVEVTRLDETREDEGRVVFGSDHHPLLARIELNPAASDGQEH